MKNLKEVALRSKKINQRDTGTWLPIYFSFRTNTVYTAEGQGRFFVTKLIRENTPEEIEEAIIRWKNT